MTKPCVIPILNARVQPLDRCGIWEDPLHELLAADGLGEVTGGDTQFRPLGEVVHCDVELGVHDTSEMTLNVIADALNTLGAPKGSRLLLGDPERAMSQYRT